jgi:hypothetical protein
MNFTNINSNLKSKFENEEKRKKMQKKKGKEPNWARCTTSGPLGFAYAWPRADGRH